jgi:hypothetical protein
LCDISVELESETTQSFCCFSFTDRTISPRSLACRAADSLACSRRPALVHQASYMQRRLTLAHASPFPIALLSHTIDVVYSSSSLPPFRLHCLNELLLAHSPLVSGLTTAVSSSYCNSGLVHSARLRSLLWKHNCLDRSMLGFDSSDPKWIIQPAPNN